MFQFLGFPWPGIARSTSGKSLRVSSCKDIHEPVATSISNYVSTLKTDHYIVTTMNMEVWLVKHQSHGQSPIPWNTEEHCAQWYQLFLLLDITDNTCMWQWNGSSFSGVCVSHQSITVDLCWLIVNQKPRSKLRWKVLQNTYISYEKSCQTAVCSV